MHMWMAIPVTNTLIKRLILLFLLSCLVGGCETEHPVTEEKIGPVRKIVSGLLEHFPENVQSTQAWYGHYYMVGDIPVIPTKEVPAEILQGFIGSEVVIEGVWYPGEKWQPATEEGISLPNPTQLGQAEVVRGDGVKISSIAKNKE